MFKVQTESCTDVQDKFPEIKFSLIEKLSICVIVLPLKLSVFAVFFLQCRANRALCPQSPAGAAVCTQIGPHLCLQEVWQRRHRCVTFRNLFSPNRIRCHCRSLVDSNYPDVWVKYEKLLIPIQKIRCGRTESSPGNIWVSQELLLFRDLLKLSQHLCFSIT